MAIVYRPTVDGRGYFLLVPVTELKNQILTAIKDGDGHNSTPTVRGGPGYDNLFSPAMPATCGQV